MVMGTGMNQNAQGGTFPLISLVIPVKNEERRVLRCLESVLSVDYPAERVEVVVVDNDSSDNSAAVVANRCRGVANARLIRSDASTIAKVRMDGFAATRGEVVGFVDGDTVVHADWLRTGLDILYGRDDVSCVGFAIAMPERSDPWVERTWYGMSSGSRWSGTQEVPWLSSFNLLLKRKFFEQVGGFDVSLKTCEDADLGFRLNQVSKLIFSDRLTMVHLGNVKTLLEFFKKEMWRGQGNLKQFWKSKSKKDDYKSVFAPIFYLAALLLLLAGLVAGGGSTAALAVIAPAALFLVVLPVFLSFRAKPQGIVPFFQTTILYCIYLLARGAAIVRR
jgi:glycosyltransferase involved in cell wall biosynthesis